METSFKYPKTPYLGYSPSIAREDRVIENLTNLVRENVVITVKMDGENVTIYPDHWHCRSLDSKSRDYHSYLASVILPDIQYRIPSGYRLCGEYLYATHSIHYENLESYFRVFSVWNGTTCLSWDDTKAMVESLGLHTVREVYRGRYMPNIVKAIGDGVIAGGDEGIVIRTACAFEYPDFASHVAKYVRKDHVQSDAHWSLGEIVPNGLMKN